MAVTRINEKMELFFKHIQLGGSCTLDQAKLFLNDKQIEELRAEGIFKEKSHPLMRSTLRQLHKDGAITDKTFEKINTQKIPNVNVISISPKGRRFADKVFEIKDMHTSTTAFHDIKIFSKTLTLSKTELESAKTESQIRKELKNTIRDFRNNPETKAIYKAKMEEMNDRFKDFEKHFMKKCEYGSPSDMGYRSDATGQFVAYEVVTVHYSEFEKAVKEFSAWVQGYTYEQEVI